MPKGQWAQPTSLGFSVIIGGLTIASLRRPAKPNYTSKVRKSNEKAQQGKVIKSTTN